MKQIPNKDTPLKEVCEFIEELNQNIQRNAHIKGLGDGNVEVVWDTL